MESKTTSWHEGKHYGLWWRNTSTFCGHNSTTAVAQMGFVFPLFWLTAMTKSRKGDTAVQKYVLHS